MLKKTLKALQVPPDISLSISLTALCSLDKEESEAGMFSNGALVYIPPIIQGLPFARYTGTLPNGRSYAMAIQWSNNLRQFTPLVQEYSVASSGINKAITSIPGVFAAKGLMGVKGWFLVSRGAKAEVKAVISEYRGILESIHRRLLKRVDRVEKTYWEFKDSSDVAKLALEASNVTVAYLKSVGQVSKQMENEVRTDLLSMGMHRIFKGIRSIINNNVPLKTVAIISIGSKGVESYGDVREDFLEVTKRAILTKEIGLTRTRKALGVVYRALIESPFTWRSTKTLPDPSGFLNDYYKALSSHCHGSPEIEQLKAVIAFVIHYKDKKCPHKWLRPHLLKSIEYLIENPAETTGFISKSIKYARR